MEKEFIAALWGAFIGGGFTLIGSFGATMYAEHKAQLKADQIRLQEIHRELQNVLSNYKNSTLFKEMAEGMATPVNEKENLRVVSGELFIKSMRSLVNVKSLSVSLYKNVDLAVRLYRLEEFQDAESLESLASDVHKRINPQLHDKLRKTR